ncbi:23998_t:CDS:2 [Gigaspora margarita]|uniref:23998_t:CDS:1 n=1 Tax=Gigaspora margarita TaxID=4874 RepID=A0ABM8VY36_GIGMA|nr:23998_t:CDS:2 [Gigaspora margarita]
MNPLVDDTSTNDVYLEIQYPQAEIVFEKENIQPSEELENAINTALNKPDPHHKLMKVFDKYGHFFAQKITLGRRLYRKSKFTLNEMPDLRNFHEVFDGVYDMIGDKLTLWEDHIKQHNLDSSYLISSDGDLVQRDDLKEWTNSCLEYPHKSLTIIKKSNLTPLYEIFNDLTIQNIQSVLGISDRCSGQLTTHEINERVLMTGVFQIRKPIKYYRINFDTHLKSHDYKVFGNVVNEKHQVIEGFVVNFDSENKSGFSIMIESSKDVINVDWSEFQINWILVGKPAEIGFYSVNTRNIRILHKGINQFTQSDKFISLEGLENLPSSSILVTSFSYPSYILFNTEPLFIAKIQNYNNKDLELNINPLDFDENDKPDDDNADSDDSADNDENNSNNSIDLHWFVISESHEPIKADIVSESHESLLDVRKIN